MAENVTATAILSRVEAVSQVKNVHIRVQGNAVLARKGLVCVQQWFCFVFEKILTQIYKRTDRTDFITPAAHARTG